ncbi:cilia- and flagella-associated protein 53-like [Dysidea avara]|uniref:cilia- and flagella-associated protein 53-like n=1 Tax=Dysidea avara TaxID=196820 RepID=UPI00331E3262
MELLRTRRTREINGPTPNSVAIRAKPTIKKPREYLILERRKQEELRNEANAMVQYTKQFDLKTTWEMATDKKIQKNTIKRRVENLLQKEKYSLEERRDKLRDLLVAEEKEYLQEMSTKEETVLERQAKMREKAKMLRDKRESERLALVEKKLDQRWRDQCEELRATLSKRNQDMIIRERDEQIRIKEQLTKQQQQEEKMFAELWEEDRLTKSKREEMEAAMQLERNREMLRVLNIQTAALEKQKEELQRLRIEEGELLREQAMLRAIEEQRMREDKVRSQENTRNMLDYSLKLKMKRKAKEVQEELALDMKILEQLLQETDNEAMEQLQRKRELNKEMAIYREYLAKQKNEEEKREKELDALIQAEVQKQWARRLELWRQEKAARKKLMQDVLDARKQQIKEKLAIISEERREAEEERKRIQANIEEHKKLEAVQQVEMKRVRVQHQSDLLQQMEHQKHLKNQEKQRERNEFEDTKATEKDYQRKLHDALFRQYPDKVHPKRLLSSGPF